MILRSGRQLSPISIIVVLFVALLLYILIAPRGKGKATSAAGSSDGTDTSRVADSDRDASTREPAARRTRHATHIETPGPSPISIASPISDMGYNTVPNSATTAATTSPFSIPSASPTYNGVTGNPFAPPPKSVSFGNAPPGGVGAFHGTGFRLGQGLSAGSYADPESDQRCSAHELFQQAGLVSENGGPNSISMDAKLFMQEIEMIATTDIRQSRFDSALSAQRDEAAARGENVSDGWMATTRADWEGRVARALQDQWDPIYGPVPTSAVEAAIMVAPWITQLVGDKILHAILPAYGESIVHSFFERATGQSNQEIPPGYRFAIAWFAEEYRSVGTRAQVRIRSDLLPVGEGHVASQLLRWLQYIGQLFAQQRVFTREGLDLDGLAARISFPPLSVSASGVTRIKYDLVLTVFMWGGDTPTAWSQRLERSIDALRRIWPIAMDSIQHDLPKEAGDPIRRARLIFRPGWPICLASQTFGTTGKRQGLLPHAPREPKIIYLDNPNSHSAVKGFIDDEPTVQRICDVAKRLLSRIPFFQAADLVNIRQFDFDDMTLSDTNQRLTKDEVVMASFIIGSAASNATNVHFSNDGLSSEKHPPAGPLVYDLSGYYPIYLSQGPDEQGDGWAFTLPNDGLVGTSTYVLPYISESYQQGCTASLLTDPKFGLADFLAKPIFKRYTQLGTAPVDTKLRVIITLVDDSAELRFRRDILEAWYFKSKQDIAVWISSSSGVTVDANGVNDELDRQLRRQEDILQQVTVHSRREEEATGEAITGRPVVFLEEEREGLAENLRYLRENTLKQTTAQGADL